jgi:hypothetical protein
MRSANAAQAEDRDYEQRLLKVGAGYIWPLILKPLSVLIALPVGCSAGSASGGKEAAP